MKQQERFFRRRMREIVSAIRAVGLDPYSQLAGYIRTGDDAYITQYENARIKIRFLDRDDVFQFLQEHLRQEKLDAPSVPEGNSNQAQCNCGLLPRLSILAQSGLDRHSASSSARCGRTRPSPGSTTSPYGKRSAGTA